MAPETILAARRVSKAFRVDGRITHALEDITLEARAGVRVHHRPLGVGQEHAPEHPLWALARRCGEVLLHGRSVGATRSWAYRLYAPEGPPPALAQRPGERPPGPGTPGARPGGGPPRRPEALAHFDLAGFADDYPATSPADASGWRSCAPFSASRRSSSSTKPSVRSTPSPAWRAPLAPRRVVRVRRTVILVTHDVEEAVYLPTACTSFPAARARGENLDHRPAPPSRPGDDQDPRFIAYREALLSAGPVGGMPVGQHEPVMLIKADADAAQRRATAATSSGTTRTSWSSAVRGPWGRCVDLGGVLLEPGTSLTSTITPPLVQRVPDVGGGGTAEGLVLQRHLPTRDPGAGWDWEILWRDLALDLLVFPDGTERLLDEDEFEALSPSAEVRARAAEALATLRAWLAAGREPFEGWIEEEG